MQAVDVEREVRLGRDLEIRAISSVEDANDVPFLAVSPFCLPDEHHLDTVARAASKAPSAGCR
ncbi:MAG: hypothetical protein ACXVRU_14010 [Gaiellaceae bacterium]